MAVFTEVSFDEARSLVERLDIGALRRLAGIAAGIENTNYFVTTERGEYVLTLFERLTFEQLPFYLRLMKHLAQRGIPVPEPQADAGGEILHAVAGKPAALVNKLRGVHQLAPDIDHCEQVGAMLARMHLAGQDFGMHQPNLRGLDWWVETVPIVRPHVTPEQAQLLDSELEFQRTLAASPAYATLPRGPIHADLFRDNVMFEGPAGQEKLTGFFDFYFAGVDTFLFDVAVCLNDWCVDLDTGRLVEERAAAFAAAYGSRREWDSAEYRLLPALMRAAAFRFWLSRLWDLHLPRDAALLKAHDPEHFERVLRERIARPWHPAVA
jgi:homoserine kinase type II